MQLNNVHFLISINPAATAFMLISIAESEIDAQHKTRVRRNHKRDLAYVLENIFVIFIVFSKRIRTVDENALVIRVFTHTVATVCFEVHITRSETFEQVQE